MGHITHHRAKQILGKIPNHRLVVLGDLMLDEFIWGNVSRIAPEAPVPVVNIQKESHRLGGAGNVVNNIRAVGATAIPVSVVGSDDSADRLFSNLKENGIEVAGIVADDSRPTTTKTRIIAHNQLVVRTDRESRKPLDSRIEERVLDNFAKLASDCDAIIISDYDKGVLTPRVLESAIKFACERNIPVCVDPKIRYFSYYRNATAITPNHHEAARVTASVIESEEDLTTACRRIREMLNCDNILVTRGEEGMSLFAAESATHIPAVAREVYDVTGAGDTVVAMLTLALTAGATMLESAALANYAAGLVVAKVGTAVVEPEELLTSIKEER